MGRCLGGVFSEAEALLASESAPSGGLDRRRRFVMGVLLSETTRDDRIGGTMSEGKRLTKAQIISEIAEKTGLSKKQVGETFESLSGLIKRELGKRGPKEFVIPDLLKLKVKEIAARKAEMRKNPFTGEMKQYPAKPASRKVRATALKKLKDLIN